MFVSHQTREIIIGEFFFWRAPNEHWKVSTFKNNRKKLFRRPTARAEYASRWEKRNVLRGFWLGWRPRKGKVSVLNVTWQLANLVKVARSQFSVIWLSRDYRLSNSYKLRWRVHRSLHILLTLRIKTMRLRRLRISRVLDSSMFSWLNKLRSESSSKMIWVNHSS